MAFTSFDTQPGIQKGLRRSPDAAMAAGDPAPLANGKRHSKRWQVPDAPMDRANYQDLRSQIRTGDLLLFRGDYTLSHVIERLSDSPYSHIGILARWKDRVIAFQADTRGVEILPASRMVCRYKGKVDWWSCKPELREGPGFEEKLLNTAVSLLGVKYGYLPLIRLGLRILFGRTLDPSDAHSTPDSLFCSQFVSRCYREASNGKLDPNPKLSDACTSPSDFVKSGYFEPKFQLFDGSNGAACMGALGLGPTEGRGPRRRRIPTWNGTEVLHAPEGQAHAPTSLPPAP